MGFRIAIGPCCCRNRLFPPRNEAVRQVCRELESRLQTLESFDREALGAIPREYAEVVELESGAALFLTLKVDLSQTETLVVLAAAVPTLWLPTYISTDGVGHLVSEGLIFSSDGSVTEAAKELMWRYR